LQRLYLQPNSKKDFGDILKKKGVAPDDHLKELKACLSENKLMWKETEVDPKLFLPHKNNRGGLLLSPHNVHRNAAKILASGANMANLTNALCVEMPAAGPARAAHIQKNNSLIQRSSGLLAPISGGERYLSLGCGHTVAFCKAAQISGVTSAPSLQVPGATKIDLQKICQSTDFATMVRHGWSWEVVSSAVDVEFDLFSRIAQKALNTQNGANTAISELECMMQLEGMLSDPGFKDEPNYKEQALENIAAMVAPCASYASILLDYVDVYVGGDGAPLVDFMDSVAKGFGCNVSLGGYWSALYGLSFSDKTKKYPLIRCALALANLTGDKVDEGFAKTVGKTDVGKITAKAKAAEAEEVEGILADAMEIATAIGGMQKVVKPLGQLFVRIGLKASQREKYGRERKAYECDDIRSMYLGDVGKILGEPVAFDKWPTTKKQQMPPQRNLTPPAHQLGKWLR